MLLQKSSAIFVFLIKVTLAGCPVVSALMRDLEAQKLLGCIRSRLDGVTTVKPSCCFHILPYSDSLLNNFGKHCILLCVGGDSVAHSCFLQALFSVRCMWAVPEPSGVVLSRQKCLSNPEMEQVVIFTLCGTDMSQRLSLLHRMLTGEPEGGWSISQNTAAAETWVIQVAVNNKNSINTTKPVSKVTHHVTSAKCTCP